MKAFLHASSGQGELITPPSPCSLSADSDRPRQRSSSSRVRGRSAPLAAGAGAGEVVAVETIDCRVESQRSTTSMHPLSLGRLYTPSLPDDSSACNLEAEAYLDTSRKDSRGALLEGRGASAGVMACTSCRLRIRAYIGCRCRGRRRVIIPLSTCESDSLASSLASLIVKGSGGGENKRKVAPYSDVVSALSSPSISALFLI